MTTKSELGRILRLMEAFGRSDARDRDLLQILSQLRAEDLALAESMARLDRSTAWTSQGLYGGHRCEATLFMIPAGYQMPIHDHPGMSVWLRVLWGRMRLRSFDWDRGRPMSGWAFESGDEVLDGASAVAQVSSHHRNLHGIEALEDLAFIDVFTPRYDPAAGRDCNYYRIVEAEGGFVRLQAADRSS